MKLSYILNKSVRLPVERDATYVQCTSLLYISNLSQECRTERDMVKHTASGII